MLEPLRSSVTCLQGNIGFKKTRRSIISTKTACEKTDELYQSVHAKAVSLTNEYGVGEKWKQSCGQQINWNIIPSETVKEYCQKSVYLPFLNIVFAEVSLG